MTADRSRNMAASVRQRLMDIAKSLCGFLMPPTRALVGGGNFEMDWLPSGPWQARTGA
jgi:hypothetical protein